MYIILFEILSIVYIMYFKDICSFFLGYYMNCDIINIKIISILLVIMIFVYNKKFRFKYIFLGFDGE